MFNYRDSRRRDPMPIGFDLGYSNPFWVPPSPPDITLSSEAPKPADDVLAIATDLPPVIVPPEPEIDPAQRARRLLQPAFQAVGGLDLRDDEELKARSNALLGQLISLVEKLSKILADTRERKITYLTTKHEAAAAACREQRIVIEALTRGEAQKLADHRSAREIASKARALFNVCDQHAPNLDNWPSRIEVARWETEHARLEKALEAAQDAESTARAEMWSMRQKVREARAKLEELSAVERDLRDRLSGKETPDPETGLMRGAEV